MTVHCVTQVTEADAIDDKEERTLEEADSEGADNKLEVSEPPQQVLLGRKAKELFLEGDLLDDGDIVMLVVDAVLSLQQTYTAWKSDHPGETPPRWRAAMH